MNIYFAFLGSITLDDRFVDTEKLKKLLCKKT